MADALKKFGKYFLLDMIAQGGMAEIYRARMAAIDGGGRLLAVKRIIGNYSENKEFVEMFKSEIKTTSGFTHPNIVQLYDYGEEGGMLYIAMELVDGRNLRQFITRFAELKQMFPVEVSVYIMEQAAHGMAYAHGYKDKITGKSLNIVHRDISPQNLLISYDGAVKVIDFGIAKATTNNEATRAGVIKGKPSYLSPEQISGDVLDGRSDIFALGIVLWELLTGKKLFASDNDYGVLKLIENCQNHVKPPSMFNPKVTTELDSIVMKCLAKNRDQRYQTCEEMQRALHKYLYQFAPDFNPADLAYYARDLFKNEIVEDRKRLLKLNEKVEQLLQLPEAPRQSEQDGTRKTVALQAGTGKSVQESDQTISLNNPIEEPKKTGSFRVVDFKEKEKTNVTLDFGPSTKPNAPKQNTSSGVQNRQQFAVSGSSPRLNTKTNLTSSGFRRPETEKKRSPLFGVAMILAIAGAYLGGAFDPYLSGKTEQVRQPAANQASVMVDANLKTATVSINGKEMATQLPAQLKIAAGENIQIKVFSNGYQPQVKTLSLKAGEATSLMFELAPENGQAAPVEPAKQEVGGHPVQLRIVVNPPGPGTSIQVNGQVIDSSGITSVTSGRAVDITVERDGFRIGRDHIDPALLAGKDDISREINLVQAKFGYVSIKTTPSGEAILTIDGAEEKWPLPVSRRRLPVGTYKVRLVNSLLGMEKTVEIVVGEDRFSNVEERLTVSGETQRTPGSQ